LLLGALDVEVGFASQKKITETPFDQDVLGEMFNQSYENQIFAPGQRLIMDHKNIPLSFMVKTVQLVDLSMAKGGSAPTVSAPQARGILTKQTIITFYKDAKSPIKLKGSAKQRQLTPSLPQISNSRIWELAVRYRVQCYFPKSFRFPNFPSRFNREVGYSARQGYFYFLVLLELERRSLRVKLERC